MFVKYTYLFIVVMLLVFLSKNSVGEIVVLKNGNKIFADVIIDNGDTLEIQGDQYIVILNKNDILEIRAGGSTEKKDNNILEGFPIAVKKNAYKTDPVLIGRARTRQEMLVEELRVKKSNQNYDKDMTPEDKRLVKWAIRNGSKRTREFLQLGSWRTEETAHFIFFSELPDTKDRKHWTQWVVDDSEFRLKKIMFDLGLREKSLKRKIKMFLIESYEFMNYWEYEEQIDPYYKNEWSKHNEIYCGKTAFIDGLSWYFAYKNTKFKKTPYWILRGFAEYQSEQINSGDVRTIVEKEDKLRIIKQQEFRKKLIPFKKLLTDFNLDPRGRYEEHEWGAIYIQTLKFIELILQRRNSKGFSSFLDYVERYSAGLMSGDFEKANDSLRKALKQSGFGQYKLFLKEWDQKIVESVYEELYGTSWIESNRETLRNISWRDEE